MLTPNKSSNWNRGFTLIELMLAMLIATIVMAATFSIFKKQQDHYTAQMDVTMMQQNIRAALNIMTRDIRMAGFDLPGTSTATIVNAEPDLFAFTVDLDENGDVDGTGEQIAFYQYTDAATGNPTLGRTTIDPTTAPPTTEIDIVDLGGGDWDINPGTAADTKAERAPAADNIEHLEFRYFDEDGNVTTDEVEVRSVEITLVARANSEDPNFENSRTYTSPSSTDWVKNDNYRRRMQTMTVQCRNIGI